MFKSWIYLFWSVLCVSFTSACSPVQVLNAMIPDGGYKLKPDIAYGDLERQKLDIYLPKKAAGSEHKVVVFFYGGSWDSGKKENYKFVAEALTSQGFVVVIPDYRLYPAVTFPAFIDDAAQALAWVKHHIDRYGGNRDELFIAGHSAGAHIAAMLTLDKQYLNQVGLHETDIKGMIGLAGPYDFLPLQSSTLKKIFGPKPQRWRSQPINFVSGDNPPMLLMVGMKDKTVYPSNTLNLAAKIKQHDGRVQVREFKGWGHVDMVSHLAKPLRGDGRLLTPIVAFINNH